MNNEHDPLSEERIDVMRSNVMNRVNKPRVRTARFASAVGAAAIVSAVSLVGVGYVVGGASQTGSDARVSDEAFISKGLDSELGAEVMTDSSGKTLSVEPSVADPDYVIVTGSVDVAVKSPNRAAKELRETIRALGGHIDSESQYSDSGDTVHLTVRVPRDKVDSLTESIESLGKITSTSIDRVQVTQQVKDLDARIEALRVSTGRLQTIMKEAQNTSDLLEAESRLAQRQAELEGLLAQRKGLGDQTEMATINVTLTQTSAAGTVNPGGFKGGLISGWNALVGVVNAGVAGFGFLLPWLVPLVALGLGARWLIRRRR
ncbi:MAG: DUF4349 domain-containing protein [Actinomycetales bacterium]|nr:DUF4349 domain-containing protein [Actinomycetales bacterium]